MGAIFVKFEPNERVSEESTEKIDSLKRNNYFRDGKPLFTKYSFWLDISPEEDALLAKLQQKTRYNVRLAEKKGVVIVEDNSEVGFEDYWKLTEETTKRQGFYSHTKSYHRKMWQTMTYSGVGHIFKAVYEDKILATWVVFCLNDVLYYPYGASSNLHREVMASNLMMWEVIKFGKKQNCKLFDLWGSLGPDPDTGDPWYGFHRFKQGYGAELVQFVGTYDLVVDEKLYSVYNVVDKMRWIFLKFLARFKK
jgi:lipid II:glycine glycyltransferase (peptidoglycan interpeptide bridge formation enzyme)